MLDGIDSLIAAGEYGRRGWAVFPCYTIKNGTCSCGNSGCGSPGKHPKVNGGFQNAQITDEGIAGFRDLWNYANIAIATGTKSNLFVIDVDRHNPTADGEDSLRDLEEQFGRLPQTVESITGNGRQLFFKMPEGDWKCKAGVRPGIDVRANGGYVVAPPSDHISGRQYVWESSSHPNEVPLADVPSWFLDLLTEKKPDATSFKSPEKINDGVRNVTLFKTACSLRAKNLAEPAILAAISAENEAKCTPPKSEAEVRAIVDSALKYAPGTSQDGNGILETISPLLDRPDIDFAGLKQKFGDPYFLKPKSAILSGINESFWAGLHNTEHVQLFDPDENIFYRYNPESGIYKDITEAQVKSEISATLLHWARVAEPELETKRTNANLNSIIAHLKGISETRGAFQKNKTYVHLANAVIEFTGQGPTIVPFSPKLYSRNQSPINYVEGAKCERFLNELLLPVLSNDDALIVQKYSGLCLLGKNLIQRFCIFDGPAGSGKSTLAKVIQKAVGQANVTELRTRFLADRFEIFRFLRKTLLTSVDVPGNFLSEKGAHQIKGLVGGDYFDAEMKGGTANYPLKGEFPMLITSNSRLHVKLDGDQGAWKRRFLICRFADKRPEVKVPDFDDVLIKDEGAGIINFMLAGLEMLLEDVAKSGDITLPESQTTRIDALLAESDQVKQFLEACVENDVAQDLSTEEIIQSFAAYCSDMGWQPKPITAIEKELPSLMLELFKTAKCNSIVREGKSCKGYSCVKFKV